MRRTGSIDGAIQQALGADSPVSSLYSTLRGASRSSAALDGFLESPDGP
jgi:hypothetical protein